MIFLKPYMRVVTALVGIASLIATALLIYILEPVEGAGADGVRSHGSVALALSRYFTILTNTIISYLLLAAAIRGYWKSWSLYTGATVWIVLVGVIYHYMLAAMHNPTGPAAITNHIHHSFIPVAAFIIWLVTRPRDYIDAKAPLYWLIFPFLYTLYTIARVEIFGDIYPYPFADPTGTAPPPDSARRR